MVVNGDLVVKGTLSVSGKLTYNSVNKGSDNEEDTPETPPTEKEMSFEDIAKASLAGSQFVVDQARKHYNSLQVFQYKGKDFMVTPKEKRILEKQQKYLSEGCYHKKKEIIVTDNYF